MQTTMLSFSNLHQHGELFANFMRARRESFIVHKRWDLPEEEGMEFDQYDTPQSRWVAIHERGEILAGVRFTPTTARCGIYSYMIRDAQLGILGGDIPSDLLYDEAPVAPHIWEGTRMFVSQSVPMSIRPKVQRALLEEMVVAARSLGAAKLIAIVTGQWPLWNKRMNINLSAIGRPLQFVDGTYQTVQRNLADKLH